MNGSTSASYIYSVIQTGLENLTSVEPIVFKPNPFRNHTVIKIPKEFAGRENTVEIFNLLGEKISIQKIYNIETSIDRNWKPGVYYYIYYSTGQIISTGKLIIN